MLRSEWGRFVLRSEWGRFALRSGCRRGTFWVPAFAGTTVGDGLRGECLGPGGFAEAPVEELAGGGHAVVGSEAPELAYHYVYEEASDGASVAGVFSD